MPDIFQYTDISTVSPEQGKVYLLDANIWKFILTVPDDLSAFEKAYVDFCEGIFNLATNEKCKHKPSIYINGLIISEVVNAILKAKLQAYNDSGGSSLEMKAYRKTQDFKNNLKAIKSDIDAYRRAFLSVADLSFDPVDILVDIPENSNYNDHYYYKIALNKQYTIVTNDSDFIYKNVEIVTGLKSLIKLMQQNS